MPRAGKLIDIKQNEEDGIRDEVGRIGSAARGAGQAAGEYVQKQADSEALVGLRSSQRQNRAARLTIQHARIGGRPTAFIQQPALRHRLPLVESYAHFSLGTYTGADVENNGMAVGWRSEAQRIGADTCFNASRWSDATAKTVAIDGGDKRHVLFG